MFGERQMGCLSTEARCTDINDEARTIRSALWKAESLHVISILDNQTSVRRQYGQRLFDLLFGALQ